MPTKYPKKALKMVIPKGKVKINGDTCFLPNVEDTVQKGTITPVMKLSHTGTYAHIPEFWKIFTTKDIHFHL